MKNDYYKDPKILGVETYISIVNQQKEDWQGFISLWIFIIL